MSLFEQFFLIKLRWYVGRYRSLLAHAFPVGLAHRPLCGMFDRDILYVGSIPTCKHCLSLLLGMILGISLSWFRFDLAKIEIITTILACSFIFSRKVIFQHLAMFMRLGLSVACGTVSTYAIMMLILEQNFAYVAILVMAYGFAVRLRRLRRQQNRRVCEECPQFGKPGTCSGFIPHKNSQIAFDDAMQEQLKAHLQQCYYEPPLKSEGVGRGISSEVYPSK